MQNMKYYYDFSGQKFGYPLSLSINSFSRQVFYRHSSLEITYVLKGEYEVITENFSHIIKEHELLIIAPNDIHIIRQNSREENVILTIHIDFSLFPSAMIGEIKHSYESNPDRSPDLRRSAQHVRCGHRSVRGLLQGRLRRFPGCEG